MVARNLVSNILNKMANQHLSNNGAKRLVFMLRAIRIYGIENREKIAKFLETVPNFLSEDFNEDLFWEKLESAVNMNQLEP